MRKMGSQPANVQRQAATTSSGGAAMASPQREKFSQLEAAIASNIHTTRLGNMAAIADASPVMAAQRKIKQMIGNSALQIAPTAVDRIARSPRQLRVQETTQLKNAAPLPAHAGRADSSAVVQREISVGTTNYLALDDVIALMADSDHGWDDSWAPIVSAWLDQDGVIPFDDVAALAARLEAETGEADDDVDAADEVDKDAVGDVDDPDEEHADYLRLEMEKRVLQRKGTNQCWYLSVFEGLHQSGLNFEIILNNPDFLNEAYDPKGSRPVWQKIFEQKMEEQLGIDKSAPRPTKTKPNRGMAWDDILKQYFEINMPTYDYTATEKNVYGVNVLGQLPALSAVTSNGVEISPDHSIVRFHTVDKKGHAMFYLGKTEDKKVLVYNQQTGQEEAYEPSDINFLATHTFTLKG